MSDDKKAPVDNETILLTLDQIGQTIDIMTNVVGRLRGYITEHMDDPEGLECERETQQHNSSNTVH
jgi:hypothetical protein